MDSKIREQILFIRDTGLTNMFDVRNVRELASSFSFDELYEFLNEKENRDIYCNFILKGD